MNMSRWWSKQYFKKGCCTEGPAITMKYDCISMSKVGNKSIHPSTDEHCVFVFRYEYNVTMFYELYIYRKYQTP